MVVFVVILVGWLSFVYNPPKLQFVESYCWALQFVESLLFGLVTCLFLTALLWVGFDHTLPCFLVILECGICCWALQFVESLLLSLWHSCSSDIVESAFELLKKWFLKPRRWRMVFKTEWYGGMIFLSLSQPSNPSLVKIWAYKAMPNVSFHPSLQLCFVLSLCEPAVVLSLCKPVVV
jgi:hypothetical protein